MRSKVKRCARPIKRKRLDAAGPVADLAGVVHYNQRYAFVSSARLDVQAGTGVSPLVLGLMAALARKGKKVALVAPTPLRLTPALLGAWFNRTVARTLGELEMDVAIGFAGDGFRYARARRRSRFVAFLSEVTPDGTKGGPGRARRERIACRDGDLVVVTSAYARSRVVNAYGLSEERVAVVPCGVDPDEWSQRALPEHDRPRVLAIAAGVPAAGLEWLLDGFARLRDTGLDAELHLAGARPDFPAHHGALVGKSKHAITFTPTPRSGLRRSDLKAEIGASDLYVQIDSRSGLAPHLLWAMATGRPVIAPKVGDFPEVVGPGGTLLPPGDPALLARAMADILRERAHHSDLATRARRRALELNWDAAASRFGELLSEL